MSTRSNIAIENEDGTVTFIYCHFDGYLDGVGQVLYEDYQDAEKIRQLMALGDISSLESEIGEKHDFDTRDQNQTTAYGRDRGETGTEANTCSLTELLEDHQEFFYVYRLDGQWYWTADDELKPLRKRNIYSPRKYT